MGLRFGTYCLLVLVVLPQIIVPNNISDRFCPSNPNHNSNSYPYPNEAVCCGAGRQWG